MKRSSRIAKRQEIENRLTAVEKALRQSQAKKEYDEAAARKRAAAENAKQASQTPDHDEARDHDQENVQDRGQENDKEKE